MAGQHDGGLVPQRRTGPTNVRIPLLGSPVQRRGRSSVRRGTAPSAGGAATPATSIFIRSPSDRLRTGFLTQSRRCRAVRSVRHASPRNLRAWDAIDRPIELERVQRGQIPLQLVAVAHHQGQAPRQQTPRRSPLAEERGRAPWPHQPVGCSSPDNILSVVVLLAPFGPRKPTTSPGATSNETPSTAVDLLRLPAYEALRGRTLRPASRSGTSKTLRERRNMDGRVGHAGLCAGSGSAGADPDRANIPEGVRFAAAAAAGHISRSSSASRASSRTARRARRSRARAGSRSRR